MSGAIGRFGPVTLTADCSSVERMAAVTVPHIRALIDELKAACQKHEATMLAPGEVVDCDTQDDVVNMRNLQRVIATSLDGHDLEYFYPATSQWYLVPECSYYRINTVFRRVGGAS